MLIVHESQILKALFDLSTTMAATVDLMVLFLIKIMLRKI